MKLSKQLGGSYGDVVKAVKLGDKGMMYQVKKTNGEVIWTDAKNVTAKTQTSTTKPSTTKPKNGQHYSTRPTKVTPVERQQANEQLGVDQNARTPKGASPVQLDKMSQSQKADINQTQSGGYVVKRRHIIEKLQRAFSVFFDGMEFVPRINYNASRAKKCFGVSVRS